VFYNKVKGLTGLGPLEFVRKIKLKIAVHLLEKGYNVSEVAYRTGFSDVKYFSRQFKAQFGFSPSKQKTIT
jgi:AraC-like DNA-binding protein